MKKTLLKSAFVAIAALIGVGTATAAEPTVLYERTADTWTDADLTEWVNDNATYVTQTIDGGLKMTAKNSGWNSTKTVGFTEFSKVTVTATLNGGAANGREGSYDFLQLGDVSVRFDGQKKAASIVIGEETTSLSGSITRGGDFEITIELDQASKAVNVTVAGGASGSATGTSAITEPLNSVVVGHYKSAKENYEISETLKAIKVEEEPLAAPEPEELYVRTVDTWTDADLTEWVNDNATYVTQTIDGGLKMTAKNSGWNSTKTLPFVANSIVTVTATLNGGAANGREGSYDFLQLGDVSVRFDGQKKAASIVIGEETTSLSGSITRGGDFEITIELDQASKAVNVTVAGGASGSATGTSAITEPLNSVVVGHYKSAKENYEISETLKAIKVVQLEQAVQIISYTINYICDGEIIKTDTAESTSGAVVNATSPLTIDGQKYYFADGATTSMTLAAGVENVLNVEMRKAYEYNYTVKNNVNDDVKTGVCVEGESVKVPFNKYILAADGKFYTKNDINKEYNVTITPTEDNYVETLTYTLTDKENVVFYSEGEDLEGMTATSGSNADVRCSNAAGGYSDEAVTIITLQPGIYTVSLGVWGNAGSTFIVKAGDAQVMEAATAGYWFESTSEEFTVSKATDLTIEGTASSKPLDLVYIQKTGDVTPVTYIEGYTTKPVDKATVKQLKEVTIFFSSDAFDMEGGEMPGTVENVAEYVSVTKGEEAVLVASAEFNEPTSEAELPFVITLAEPATEAGDYVVTLKEGAIITNMWDDAADGYVLKEGGPINPEITLTITVDPNYQYKWSFTPENGSEKNAMPTEDDEYIFVELALPEAESLSDEAFDTENAVGPWLTYNDTPLKKETDWEFIPDWQKWDQPVLRIGVNASVFKTVGTLTISAEAGAFTVDGNSASPAIEYTASFGEKKDYTATFTPAVNTEVTAEEIRVITLTYDEAESVAIDSDNFYSMFRQGYFNGIELTAENLAIEGNTVTITLPEDYTPSLGTYLLEFGAGSFIIDGNQLSEELQANWTIIRSTEVSFAWEPSPSTDIVNQGYGINVALVFGEIETVSIADESAITIEFNGEKLGAYDYSDESKMGYMMGTEPYTPNILMINAAGGALLDVTTEGTFKVTIPAGAILVSGEATPEEITYTWNLVKAKEYEITITPADGETVKEITKVTVEFTNAETAELYNKYGISLRKSDYSATFNVQSVEAVEGAEHPTFEITFDKTAETAGTYDFIINNGTFTLDGAQDCPAVKATITVDPALMGIGSILGDAEGKTTVVNLQGIVLMKNATSEDLKTLPAGFYIINGRKVALK